MALNFSTEEDSVLSEINTTPLVDVMLVLLIIFLITIPVVTTSIKVDLPKEANQIRETTPENIVVSVDAKGDIFWYDSPVANAEDLLNRFRKVATQKPQPEVQIRGDAKANYESVGKIVYASQKSGMVKVGFVIEPPAK